MNKNRTRKTHDPKELASFAREYGRYLKVIGVMNADNLEMAQTHIANCIRISAESFKILAPTAYYDYCNKIIMVKK